MKQITRHDIGSLHIIEGEGKDEVCLSAFKSLCGHIPLLHYIAVGDVQTVENDVQHLDVIAVGLTVVIAEFVRRELPVADDHERVFLSILLHLLGGG